MTIEKKYAVTYDVLGKKFRTNIPAMTETEAQYKFAVWWKEKYKKLYPEGTQAKVLKVELNYSKVVFADHEDPFSEAKQMLKNFFNIK